MFVELQVHFLNNLLISAYIRCTVLCTGDVVVILKFFGSGGRSSREMVHHK